MEIAIALEVITESMVMEREAEDGFPREIINGVWGEGIKMAGLNHAIVIGNITDELRAYCHTTGLGKAFGDGLSFVLEGSPECIQNLRVPDVSFIQKAKLEAITNPKGYLYFAPDLAIEVVSPTEYPKLTREKILCFLSNGTAEVWVVYMDNKEVVVHFPDKTTKVYSLAETLTTPILPDFELPLSKIFAGV